MAGKAANLAPRINNRRALHEYFIEGRLECGIVLVGTEVKSLRLGRAQLNDAFARVENGELILHNCHIDQYSHAGPYNHPPDQERKLLIHKRELHRLESQTQQKGVTLIPLAIYFSERGMAKVELGVARGKTDFDKRDSIRKKEMDREVRRVMTHRG